jgi:hypothetical protein
MRSSEEACNTEKWDDKKQEPDTVFKIDGAG